jgi:hypothetical protein
MHLINRTALADQRRQLADVPCQAHSGLIGN